MATEVKLPDLGEGIDDATINRWLVHVGDSIEEGAPLLEVATDKVDTEIPSPAGGTLLKTLYGEGDIVGTGVVLAFIGEAGEDVPDASSADSTAEPAPAKQAKQDAQSATVEVTAQVAEPAENGTGVKASPVAKRVAADKGIALASVTGTGPGGRITKDDVLAADGGQGAGGGFAGGGKTLPGDLADVPTMSVKRLASENNILLSDVAEGRPFSSLNRYDVMSAVASREAGEPVTVEPRFLPPAGWTQAAAVEAAPSDGAKSAAVAPVKVGEGEELVKYSRMRQLIARNTAASAAGAPHVTTMWDVNMSAALAHRKAHKAEFEAQGVNLTVTAYLAMATVAGLRAVPAANSTYTDEGLLIKWTINLGIAVALPQDEYGLGGLIKP